MKISETDVNFGSLFAVTFIFTTLLFSLDFIVFWCLMFSKTDWELGGDLWVNSHELWRCSDMNQILPWAKFWTDFKKIKIVASAFWHYIQYLGWLAAKFKTHHYELFGNLHIDNLDIARWQF